MTGHRLRIRTVVLLTAVIPLTAGGVLAWVTASDTWHDHRVARSIAEGARHMDSIMQARTAVTDEGLATSVLLSAAQMGLDSDRLQDLYGVDFDAALATARADVDRSASLLSDAAIETGFDRVVAARAAIDRRAVGSEEGRVPHEQLNRVLDDRWIEAKDELDSALAAGAVPDVVEQRADAVRRMFEVFRASGRRIALAERTATSSTAADLRELIAADRETEAGLAATQRLLGERGSEAFHELRVASGTHRFRAALDRLIDDVLDGRESHLARDPAAFGAAFFDGAEWFGGVIELAGAASVDLGDAAAADAAREAGRLRIGLALVAAVLAASLAAVALLTRSITRPLAQIASAINEVRRGTFQLPPISQKGPRELADTGYAVNEMAATLGAVEAYALALTHRDARIESLDPLPGRTGEALQRALDRLHDRAVVDGLTGLLNRAACFDAVERLLASARRSDQRVMALFIDLDDLKTINDTYGHAAGDEAIRRTAGALRTACRTADVIARLGGDEFLVAGVTPAAAQEVEEIASRIRNEVAAVHLCHADHVIPLRCSIGMTVADPACTSVEMLIADADRAMYCAKRDGRHGAEWFQQV